MTNKKRELSNSNYYWRCYLVWAVEGARKDKAVHDVSWKEPNPR